jgi:tetratricopeptide (TPR) repeat protein
MSLLARWRASSAVTVVTLCMAAMGQQVSSISGRVQKAGGASLPHPVDVFIEGAGSITTSTTGQFTLPLPGSLKLGDPVVFHVVNWVILKPCELKNGRAYIHSPVEPVEIFVLPPGDPRLKSFAAGESIIGCLIEEESSQIAPKSRSGAGPRSSLQKEEYLPLATPADAKEIGTGIDINSDASHPHLVDAVYHLPVAQSSSVPSLPKSNEVVDPAREEFLAEKAKELGFSVAELRSAIEAWTRSVEDPYEKGLAALYNRRYAEASRYITESLSSSAADVLQYVPLARAEYEQAHYPAAESALRKVLAVHPNDPLVLNNLAVVLGARAQYSEAEPLNRRALAIDEKNLGPDHPRVAIDLNNLAELYRKQGKYSEAEPLFKRALAIDEKALGPDHPRVAIDLNNLAELYRKQGKYSEAEPLFKRALAIDEKELGPDHPNVAIRLNNLAELYQDQDLLSEAEPLLKRSLAIDEKELGPDHPRFAIDLNNLAGLYVAQGLDSKAIPLVLRALAIDERELGPDHPAVAQALNNLAFLYCHLRRYSEAEPLFKRALAINEKALGSDNPEVAINLSNLAALYDDQKKYSDAESLYKRALVIDERASGSNQANFARDLNGLGMLYFDQNRCSEAVPLFKRALAIVEEALGPDHSIVADTAENLAAALRKLGRDAEAKTYEEQAAKIREKSKQGP